MVCIRDSSLKKYAPLDSQKDITLKWRGSSNQRVIDVQSSLKNSKVVLYD